MKRYIIIKADTNDGDYVTDLSEITDDQLKKFIIILSKIPRIKLYTGEDSNDIRWENGEMGNTQEELVGEGILTIEDAEWFNQWLPSGEYGIHTIESIDIFTVTEEIKLV